VTSHRHALRNLIARGLLALALVFAQQEASLHWLSHAIEATQGKASNGTGGSNGTVAGDHCDECLALGGLAVGATSTPYAFPAEPAQHVQVATEEATLAPSLLRLAFRSRAPPILT
jgi:hypothetical protein